jgi:hypothetical protein
MEKNFNPLKKEMAKFFYEGSFKTAYFLEIEAFNQGLLRSICDDLLELLKNNINYNCLNLHNELLRNILENGFACSTYYPGDNRPGGSLNIRKSHDEYVELYFDTITEEMEESLKNLGVRLIVTHWNTYVG